MQIAPDPLPVVSTQGTRIRLADGRELVDGIASWWSACHGYNHPHILKCVEQQLHKMPHVMFGGLVHEPALTLAKRLSTITPAGLNRVFFSDSGSVAVEVALKIALQYWRNTGKPHKDRFLCFRDGYHGDTLGATLVQDEIFNAFLSENPEFAFMHGPTFMANPLACAAANASLDLFEREPRLAQVAAIEAHLLAALECCRDMPHVVDVRAKGAIGVVQLDAANVNVYALRTTFVERGVWVRPFKDIVYLMPSLSISPEDLGELTDTVADVLRGQRHGVISTK